MTLPEKARPQHAPPRLSQRLQVDPVACTGHGLCAELLPELISADDWGYPIIASGHVPVRLSRMARRAVTDCPALALTLEGRSPDRS
jgi:ferredoxin